MLLFFTNLPSVVFNQDYNSYNKNEFKEPIKFILVLFFFLRFLGKGVNLGPIISKKQTDKGAAFGVRNFLLFVFILVILGQV